MPRKALAGNRCFSGPARHPCSGPGLGKALDPIPRSREHGAGVKAAAASGLLFKKAPVIGGGFPMRGGVKAALVWPAPASQLLADSSKANVSSLSLVVIPVGRKANVSSKRRPQSCLPGKRRS